jgi:hypothetical protein
MVKIEGMLLRADLLLELLDLVINFDEKTDE